MTTYLWWRTCSLTALWSPKKICHFSFLPAETFIDFLAQTWMWSFAPATYLNLLYLLGTSYYSVFRKMGYVVNMMLTRKIFWSMNKNSYSIMIANENLLFQLSPNSDPIWFYGSNVNVIFCFRSIIVPAVLHFHSLPKKVICFVNVIPVL
jgi:hypothetical protein